MNTKILRSFHIQIDSGDVNPCRVLVSYTGVIPTGTKNPFNFIPGKTTNYTEDKSKFLYLVSYHWWDGKPWSIFSNVDRPEPEEFYKKLQTDDELLTLMAWIVKNRAEYDIRPSLPH